MTLFDADATAPWVASTALIAAVILIGLAAHLVVFAALRRGAERNERPLAGLIVTHCRKPAMMLLPLFGLLVVWPMLALPDAATVSLRRIAVLLVTGATGWIVVGAINVCGDYVGTRYTTDHTDNLDERRIQTQAQVLRRIGIVITVLVTAGVMLMTIPAIRHLGVSLFASAGIAGLAVGLAARATLSNIIAGIQIALTQPIRLDDVVIVEGEWGWIEEIRTTYVVVRIWDLRRLIVPLSHFVERPYQNWTRTTADLLGAVYFQVDYTVPIEAVRKELRRIVEGSELWDGKVCVLHVTDAKERTVELRALMGARSSPDAWELRCMVREKLIAFVQESYPDALPRVRAELRNAA